jgi:hypothetical protein
MTNKELMYTAPKHLHHFTQGIASSFLLATTVTSTHTHYPSPTTTNHKPAYRQAGYKPQTSFIFAHYDNRIFKEYERPCFGFEEVSLTLRTVNKK